MVQSSSTATLVRCVSSSLDVEVVTRSFRREDAIAGPVAADDAMMRETAIEELHPFEGRVAEKSTSAAEVKLRGASKQGSLSGCVLEGDHTQAREQRRGV